MHAERFGTVGRSFASLLAHAERDKTRRHDSRGCLTRTPRRLPTKRPALAELPRVPDAPPRRSAPWPPFTRGRDARHASGIRHQATKRRSRERHDSARDSSRASRVQLGGRPVAQVGKAARGASAPRVLHARGVRPTPRCVHGAVGPTSPSVRLPDGLAVEVRSAPASVGPCRARWRRPRVDRSRHDEERRRPSVPREWRAPGAPRAATRAHARLVPVGLSPTWSAASVHSGSVRARPRSHRNAYEADARPAAHGRSPLHTLRGPGSSRDAARGLARSIRVRAVQRRVGPRPRRCCGPD